MPTSKLLSTLVFLSIIFGFPAATTSQECPYPCYPPPTGPAVTTTPPASFSPPFVTTTPPAGVFPYDNPPSPTFYGGAQPPPEPILSWFPYYYRRPPHQDQSSSPATGGSRTIIAIFPIIALVCFM